jgi:DNA-binding transcriptional LysR family regulator
VTVAETGSFTIAAGRLFQTQSSLTGAIQQLEAAVGLKLFDRTTRRVEMTDEARRFKLVAERILRDFDNAIGDLQALAKSQRGHVRIAAAPSMMLHVVTPALAVFRQDYPNISISVNDGGSHKIEKAVLDGDMDFGIASRLNNFQDLDYVPILRDRFGVICPADHPLARMSGEVKWSDLAPYDYVGLTHDTGIASLLAAYPELGLNGKPGSQDLASSTTSLYSLLSLGGKFSVLAALSAAAGPLKEFEFRELHEPTITREVCLITRHLRSLSPSAQRFLDVLMSVIENDAHLTSARAVPLAV